MSRNYPGSRRDPLLIKYDRSSELSTLHEAKLAAWAFALGERSQSEHGGPIRPHRGMLADFVSAEEPPPGRAHRQSLVRRIAAAIGRLFEPEWGSEAHVARLLAAPVHHSAAAMEVDARPVVDPAGTEAAPLTGAAVVDAVGEAAPNGTAADVAVVGPAEDMTRQDQQRAE